MSSSWQPASRTRNNARAGVDAPGWLTAYSRREHEVKNKEFYFIMTAGGSNTECALLGFRNFIRYLPGSKEKGVIEGTGIHLKGSVKGNPVMKKAYEMGKNV